MFGQHDDKPTQKDTDVPGDSLGAVLDTNDAQEDQPSTIEPVPSAAEIKPEAPSGAPSDLTASIPSTDDDTDENKDWQHPGKPLPDDKEEKKNISDMVSPAGGFPKTPDYQYPSMPRGQAGDSDDTTDALTQDLIDIRQKALGELAPLIDQLDLPPEDKFRTIMMVIQASDEEKLVKEAYASAHEIKDERVRGQALLDIVNEINYFTAPHEG